MSDKEEISRLTAALSKAEGERDEALGTADGYREACDRAEAERDSLRSQLTEARTDLERARDIVFAKTGLTAGDKLIAERDQLRAALIATVRAAGGLADARVSSEFLTGAPLEVEGVVSKLRSQLAESEWQLAELKRGLVNNNTDFQLAFLDAYLENFRSLRADLAEALGTADGYREACDRAETHLAEARAEVEKWRRVCCGCDMGRLRAIEEAARGWEEMFAEFERVQTLNMNRRPPPYDYAKYEWMCAASYVSKLDLIRAILRGEKP